MPSSKLSALNGGVAETTFTINDFVIKVKASGSGDVLVLFNDFLKAINSNLPSVQDTWHGASYANSWVDFDTGSPAASSYGGVQYYKDSTGAVHMRGLAKSGTVTANTVMLTLPAGYRPGVIHIFELFSADARASVEVHPDGTVVTRAGISNTSVSFANVLFKAEN